METPVRACGARPAPGLPSLQPPPHTSSPPKPPGGFALQVPQGTAPPLPTGFLLSCAPQKALPPEADPGPKCSQPVKKNQCPPPAWAPAFTLHGGLHQACLPDEEPAQPECFPLQMRTFHKTANAARVRGGPDLTPTFQFRVSCGGGRGLTCHLREPRVTCPPRAWLGVLSCF